MLKPEIKNRTSVVKSKDKHRWIIGLVILGLVLVGGGYFGYVRYLVPRQIKNYVNQTVADYNRLQDQFDQTGKSFNELKVLESEKLNQFTSDIDTALKICEENSNNENKRHILKQCRELHQKLLVYYSDAREALEETKSTVSYFEKLGEITKDLEDVTIESGSGQNLDEVGKEFTRSEKKLTSVVKAMQAIVPPSDLNKLHRDLTSFIKVLKKFSTDVKDALQAEEYDQIETLTSQIESDQKSYSAKIDQDFSQFKGKGKIGNWSERLKEQGAEIDQLVSDLKLRYHF